MAYVGGDGGDRNGRSKRNGKWGRRRARAPSCGRMKKAGLWGEREEATLTLLSTLLQPRGRPRSQRHRVFVALRCGCCGVVSTRQPNFAWLHQPGVGPRCLYDQTRRSVLTSPPRRRAPSRFVCFSWVVTGHWHGRDTGAEGEASPGAPHWAGAAHGWAPRDLDPTGVWWGHQCRPGKSRSTPTQRGGQSGPALPPDPESACASSKCNGKIW